MNENETKDPYTHFGFKRVKTAEKRRHVADVFNSVASRYDIMNDVMSFGVHRIWKRIATEFCAVRNGEQVLDLAAGTGDLTARFAGLTGADGLVVAADINAAMLQRGRDRLLDAGHTGNVVFSLADAERLPFSDNVFDCVTMAFGLRNVTDKDAALRSINRVLRPGGRLVVLEFSTPVLPGLNRLYDLYSFNILPRMGRWIADDEDSYRYLAESIRMHPDQKTLQEMMQLAGFTCCDYHNLSGGIVALHRGYKP